MTAATVTIEAPAGTDRRRAPGGGAGFGSARQRHQHALATGIVSLIDNFAEVDEGVNARNTRRWGAGWLLEHLERFEGGGWQDRWDASGLEAAGPSGFRQAVCLASGVGPTANRLSRLTVGLGALITLDVVRPSFEFVLGARLDATWAHLLAWRGDLHAGVLDRVPCTAQSRAAATRVLARLAVVTGRPVAQWTAEDLLAWRDAVLARRIQTVGLGHVWLCLADAGVVEGSLHQAVRPGQKTVTELVDRYPIACRPVRDLLIAYLTERSVNIDYSTLRSLTIDLCLRFWRERIDRAGHRHPRPTRRGRGRLEGSGPVAHRPRHRSAGAPPWRDGHVHRGAGLLRRSHPPRLRGPALLGPLGVPATGQRGRGD